MAILLNNKVRWWKTSSGFGVFTFIISVLGLVYMFGYKFQSEVEIKHSYCDCFKKISAVHINKDNVAESSCSMGALRGPHQKVISYSFYDDPNTSDLFNRNFLRGIKENLEGVKQLYNKDLLPHMSHNHVPFTMRLYFQLYPSSKNKDTLCKIACTEPLLDVCEIKYSNKLFPMLWRFFPIGDANVDYLFSRDLDSRITSREVNAIHDFINSKKSLHIMRDHMNHGIPMLGGMWGVNLENKNSRERIKEGLFKMLKDPIAFSSRTESQHDQTLLQRYLWPLTQDLGLSHDSFFCQKFKGSNPFPTQRPNGILNFVGAVADLNNTIAFTERNECPHACRPENYKDWAYC